MKMKSFNPNGNAIFEDMNNKKYKIMLPQELLDFINIHNHDSIYLWYYGETESFEAEYHLNIGSNGNNWRNITWLSFNWGINSGITELDIIGIFEYKFKKAPTISELVRLLQNEKEMKKFILNEAKLNKAQYEWLLRDTDF